MSDRIGGYGATHRIEGQINDIRIYDQALTFEQIADVYTETKTIYGH